MKCVHTSQAIDGLDYNRETADRYVVAQIVCIEEMGERFELELSMPSYVRDKLGAHDWDEIRQRLRLFCRQKLPAARLVGADGPAFRVLLAIAAKLAIYECFTRYQAQAGNDAWATPMTLVGSQYPGAQNV